MRPTMRAADWRVRCGFWTSSQPAHTQVTQTVETVEKVASQKPTFEKWVKNIEKHLVFCVLNDILAIFELVVGDFCKIFSNKRFFDSLVRRRVIIIRPAKPTHSTLGMPLDIHNVSRYYSGDDQEFR